MLQLISGFLNNIPFKRDRLRTTVNVWGDSIGAGIVDHLSRKEIEALEEERRRNDGYEVVSQEEEVNGQIKIKV